MLQMLEEKITSLLEQNVSLNKKINEEMKMFKSPMNINVNILATKKDQAKGYDIKDIDLMQKDY